MLVHGFHSPDTRKFCFDGINLHTKQRNFTARSGCKILFSGNLYMEVLAFSVFTYTSIMRKQTGGRTEDHDKCHQFTQN